MDKKAKIATVIIISLALVGSSLYITYNYYTTHYDIPEDYPVIIGIGTDYYVNFLQGSDDNSGTTPENAWKTVEKINIFTFAKGDRILFACNSSWRERIIPQSGTKDGWLYYGSYGTGAKPLFIGSISLNNTEFWEDNSNNVWKLTFILEEDAGNLIFNDESSTGIKKWTLEELQEQGDFYYDKTEKILYVKSISNPASFYQMIECALGQHMLFKTHEKHPHIGVHTAHNIVFENLSFAYGGAYGLKFQNVHHIHILNCVIKWMGGAEVDGQPKIRYGNGIEFFGEAFYCHAEGNIIDQMYDSGVSYQAINSPAAAIGISFVNNHISNCAYSGLELWLHSSKGEISNFTFIHNSIEDIGYGWGAASAQRKLNAYYGFGYLLDVTPSPTKNLNISYNLVNQTKMAAFACSKIFNGLKNAFIDHNNYYGTDDETLFIEFVVTDEGPSISAKFKFDQSNKYQEYILNEINSTISIFLSIFKAPPRNYEQCIHNVISIHSLSLSAFSNNYLQKKRI